MTPEARKAIWGAFIAFFVDNYDIFLPVIALAPAITYFIPETISPTTAAIVSAMIFATTLIGRPLGALIFGHYADIIGRRRATIISMFSSGVVTLLIALLPGYAQWGVVILIVFIALRFVNGIFVGGAYTAANPLAMEHSPKEKRGIYGALVQSAAAFGTGAIAIVTLIVLYFVPAGDLNSPYVQWGWRIPFLIGAAMIFAMAIYYFYVEESEVWRESSRTQAPIRTLFSGDNLKDFMQVFVLMSGFWLSLNASIVVLPGLLASRMEVTGTSLTIAIVAANFALGFVYIAGGAVSQRIGRRTYLMVMSGISAVVGTTVYYLFISAAPGNLLAVVLLTVLVTVLILSPGALGTVYINERFQTGIRATGFGLGYSLAVILPSFYGFYQAGLASFMPIEYTVLVLAVVGAILIFVGAAWGPETKDVDFAASSPKPQGSDLNA
jgi:MFS family permease